MIARWLTLARFNEVRSDDLDRLREALQKLPEELKAELYDKGLAAAGKILTTEMQLSLADKGLIDTGQLVRSIKAETYGSYVDVAPRGTRKENIGSFAGKRARRYPKKGGTSTATRYNQGGVVRNAEVGFILEYGDSKRDAKYWMEDAATASEDDIANALEKILGDKLRQIFD